MPHSYRHRGGDHRRVRGHHREQIRFRPPQLFYTYFYSHVCRLRLEKPLYLEPPRSPNGFFNHFWIQMAVSKTAVIRRFRVSGVKRQTSDGNLFNGHSPKDVGVRSGVTIM